MLGRPIESAPGAGDSRPGGVASTYKEVPACRTVRANDEPGGESDATQEVPLARDLTTCVLDFVRDRVTPVAEWVTWTGGDPELVILVITETLRSIADGLDGDVTTSATS